jgi:putative ABC transport system permease protein
MNSLLQDIRYAVRMMVRSWPLTMLIVATMAIGIGANTAIFSVVNAILLRPLPFKAPEQLVILWITPPPSQQEDTYPAPGADYVDWRDQNTVCEAMAAFESWSYDMTGLGSPQRLDAVKVSASFFQILGVPAAKGRTFGPTEDQPGSEHVAVISHGLWEQRFGADQNIVGQPIMLDGERFTVIGVMPEGFDFPERPAMPAALQFPRQPQIWTPLVIDQSRAADRETFNLSVIGRLKQGITVSQAQSDLGAIAQRIDKQYRESYGLGLKVVPIQKQIIGDIRAPLMILVGTVSFILLIACSNVANLLLSKSVVRRREIAIRTAVGATRGRLIRQMTTESLLIALIGGGLGVLLAGWGISILLAINPGNIPRLQGISIDAKVLVFAFAASLLTGLLCAVIPTLQGTRVDQTNLLKEEHRGLTHSAQLIRMRHLLVISQIGLALALLIGAGLLIKSFILLYREELGFKPEGVLSLRIDPPEFKYRGNPPKIEFFSRVLQGIESLPEVKAAGLVTNLPMSGAAMSVSFQIDGQPVASDQESPRTDYTTTSQNFFKAMSIPLLKGRTFSEMDNERSPEVAIINEEMASRFWPGANPLGQGVFLTLGGRRSRREIIGVVGNVRRASLSVKPRPEMYVPYTQRPQAFTFLVVQTSVDPLSAVSAVSSKIHAVDPDHPVSEIRSMPQVIAESEAERTFNLLLLNIFAWLGLILALVGVYGVIAHSVTLRTSEIGIRVALGAQRSDIFKIVLKQGLLLTSIGTVIGLGIAFGLTQVMKSLLYQIGTRDPMVFLISSIVLALTALPAVSIPAFRASRLDPLDAIRKE